MSTQRLTAVISADATKFMSGMGKVGAASAKLFGQLTLISTAAFYAWQKAATAVSDYADKMLVASDSTGIGTDELQRLGYVAGQAGVELETFTAFLPKYQRALADAADGNGAAGDTFRNLGIKAKDLMELPLTEQLYVIAGALEKIENPAKRSQAALAIFGKGGAQMNTVLKALKDVSNLKAFEAKGGIISREDLQRADAFGDKIDETKTLLMSMSMDALLPSMEKAVELMEQFQAWASSDDGKQALQDIGKVFQSMASAAAELAPVVAMLAKGYTTAQEGWKTGAEGVAEFSAVASANDKTRKQLRAIVESGGVAPKMVRDASGMFAPDFATDKEAELRRKAMRAQIVAAQELKGQGEGMLKKGTTQ